MIVSLCKWWLALQLISLVGLPLSVFIFRNLWLSGYLFNKTLSLLIIGYVSWILAMLGFGAINIATILLALLLTSMVGLWVSGWMDVSLSLRSLRFGWRNIIVYEIFFITMLLAGLWLRFYGAVGPAIVGTEKPMELAFLSGILQSPTFPPQDPWLAGYSINYYYLGYLLIAVLKVISGVTTGEAFNLGLASIFALTASMIVGLLGAMIFKSDEYRTPGNKVQALSIMALGVLLVMFIGNQAGAIQELFGSAQVVALDGKQFVNALSQRIMGIDTIPIHPAIQTSPGDFDLIAELKPLPDLAFNWWWPSRFVWDTVAIEAGKVVRQYAITEFPFFSFFLGDLHPHVLSLPFGLLGLSVAFAAMMQPVSPLFSSNKRELMYLILSSIIFGSLYIINSWDAPTYVGLYIGALVLTQRRKFISENRNSALRKIIPVLVRLVAGCVFAITPFLLSFRSFAGGSTYQTPWPGFSPLGVLGKVLSLTSKHTTLYSFLGIFGVFFSVLFFYMARITPIDSNGKRILSTSGSSPLIAWITIILAFILGNSFEFPLLALLPLAIYITSNAWNYVENPVRSFVLWVIAVGTLLIFTADIVYIRDPFENRMNTIFKLYYQAWVILGVMTAYAIWALLQPGMRRHWSSPVWGGVALILLIGGMVYPIQTLIRGNRWMPAEQDLDGIAFLERQSPDEYAALLWIESHTLPDAVILTAVGSSYDDSTGRVSSVTGRPTLLGWSGSHEHLWRSGSPEILATISQREQDIPLIYTTVDWMTAQQLLENYQVDFVYIGPKERQVYSGPGLAKFGEYLKLVFDQGDVQIYRSNN